MQGSAVVKQFADPGGQAQLVARVAPVSTGRALWVDQSRLVEAA
jgi:hypothetical protein